MISKIFCIIGSYFLESVTKKNNLFFSNARPFFSTFRKNFFPSKSQKIREMSQKSKIELFKQKEKSVTTRPLIFSLKVSVS